MPIDWDAVAIHEAGHAVVAKHFGFDLYALFIKGVGTKKGGLWCDPPKQRAYTTRTDSDQFTDDDKHAMFIDVCHLLAGKRAEAIAGFPPNPGWCQDDDVEVDRIANWHFPDDAGGKKAFLHRAAVETDRILQKKMGSVNSVAKHLNRIESRIWGSELADMIG